MKKINIYTNQCPGIDDYILFLNGEGSSEFNAAFNQHLLDCPLCHEAIEGYKICQTVPEAPVKQFIEPGFHSKNRRYLYFIGSAAAAMIIASGWWALNSTPKNPVNLFSEGSIFETSITNTAPVVSKLVNQLPENYWYVCNENIYINDQEIKPDAINTAIDGLDTSKSLIIEVGCTCTENVNLLIEEIKSKKSITIITYSKNSRIKPNRS